MSDNYDTTKKSVKDAYAAVFSNPTIENKNTFMRNSDAFREAIRKREVVVVVDPPVDADAAADAAAKAAAADAAAKAAAKAAAEREAERVAAAKAAADRVAAAKAAAEREAERVAAEREAAEKAQSKKNINAKFTLWKKQAAMELELEQVKIFFQKVDKITLTLDTLSLENLKQLETSVNDGGSLNNEYKLSVLPHLGELAGFTLNSELNSTHKRVGLHL